MALSISLLESMNRNEVKGMLGHKIVHVANRDMVTLALIQGVVTAFVMLFASIFGHFVDHIILKN